MGDGEQKRAGGGMVGGRIVGGRTEKAGGGDLVRGFPGPLPVGANSQSEH